MMKHSVRMGTLVHLLTSGMGTSQEGSFQESGNQIRAEKIILFAEWVSKQVLLLAGFIEPKMVVKDGVHQMDRPYDPWARNQMASTAERPEDVPEDALKTASLQLHNIPTSLDATHDSPLAHEFVFCKRRVLEWDGKRDRAHRVLTYEETARFVLFWLAEKILQITRKNEWDRVQKMTDLYERLHDVIFAPEEEPLQTAEEVSEELGFLHDLEYTDYGQIGILQQFVPDYWQGKGEPPIFIKMAPSRDLDGKIWNAVVYEPGGKLHGKTAFFQNGHSVRRPFLD